MKIISYIKEDNKPIYEEINLITIQNSQSERTEIPYFS